MLIIRMSTHTQPEPFDPKKHDWVAYMGQFQMFLQANSLQDTTEQRKRALFLGYCGNHLYKTARTLAAPKDMETMEWKELQKKLEKHYAPAASSLAHRLDFYRREQKPEVMEEARAAEISEKPAAKIEKSESVHSAWGMTSKYQGEGEIGELSEEEEEEIHRVKPDRRSGPQGTSQRPLCLLQFFAKDMLELQVSVLTLTLLDRDLEPERIK
ncbi:hypothetical protein E2320_001841 [Naja naja]|nr:hypothetical protein E2320_001841 [Naja naja]